MKSTARSVSWFFDRVWKVKLGDPHNGYDAEAVVSSPEEAADWLRETAIRLFPESEFAELYGGLVRKSSSPC